MWNVRCCIHTRYTWFVVIQGENSDACLLLFEQSLSPPFSAGLDNSPLKVLSTMTHTHHYQQNTLGISSMACCRRCRGRLAKALHGELLQVLIVVLLPVVVLLRCERGDSGVQW